MKILSIIGFIICIFGIGIIETSLNAEMLIFGILFSIFGLLVMQSGVKAVLKEDE